MGTFTLEALTSPGVTMHFIWNGWNFATVREWLEVNDCNGYGAATALRSRGSDNCNVVKAAKVGMMRAIECDVREGVVTEAFDRRAPTEKYQGELVCHHCGSRFARVGAFPVHAVPVDVVAYRLKLDPNCGGKLKPRDFL